MSLRTRLSLVLAVLVMVPLIVGGLLVAVLVPRAQREDAQLQAERSAEAVQGVWNETCRTVGLAARTLALEATGDPDNAVQAVIEGGYASWAAVIRPTGDVLAEAGTRPVEQGSSALGPVCSESTTTLDVIRQRVAFAGADGRVAVVAQSLDQDTLESIARNRAVIGAVTLVSGEQVAVSTASEQQSEIAVMMVARGKGVYSEGGLLYAVDPVGEVPGAAVVAITEAPGIGSQHRVVLGVTVLGATVAALLILSIGSGLTRPLDELSAAAESVAGGALDTPIPRGAATGEVGRLGEAFARMSQELQRNLADLQRSRDQARGSLGRLGETLGSAHDLDTLLVAVLDAAMAAVGAEAGVVLMREGEVLRPAVTRDYHDRVLDRTGVLQVGRGVLGRVAANDQAARGRLGSGAEDLEPVPAEPMTGEVLAVPLQRQGRPLGVIALYDRADGGPWAAEDEKALASFAGHAGTAIDNVLLQQEVQRQSVTDPLTGLGNFRHLSISLAREIERAQRFDRSLAVLMFDLDHFKVVNDTYGHAAGDQVLREMSDRVQEQIREVDTLARYGGEEFVLVLPETTAEGAAMLAERICAAMRREPFLLDDGAQLVVTVSVGGASFPRDGESPAVLMRAADTALYRAKNAGRDQACVPTH